MLSIFSLPERQRSQLLLGFEKALGVSFPLLFNGILSILLFPIGRSCLAQGLVYKGDLTAPKNFKNLGEMKMKHT
jgi:hypothetical protein